MKTAVVVEDMKTLENKNEKNDNKKQELNRDFLLT